VFLLCIRMSEFERALTATAYTALADTIGRCAPYPLAILQLNRTEVIIPLLSTLCRELGWVIEPCRGYGIAHKKGIIHPCP
jgi:hypothetical protein